MNLKSLLSRMFLILTAFTLASCDLVPMAPLPTSTPVPLPFTVTNVEWINPTADFEENWVSVCDTTGELLITRFVIESGVSMRYIVGIPIEATETMPPDFLRLTLPGRETQDVKPAWSPNCQRVAVEELRGNSTNVVVMNADGTDRRYITENLPAGLTGSAPNWSPDGTRIVMTVSECTVCISDNDRNTVAFAIVNLEVLEVIMLYRPTNAGWGFMHNASFNDAGDALIFNVAFGGTDQIGIVSNVYSDNPVWQVVTSEPYRHLMPEWLPGRNEAFIYTGMGADLSGNAIANINLVIGGRSLGLTTSTPLCKDGDVRALSDTSFEVIASCKNQTNGAADFVRFQFDLP
jgi:hypothetical protein